MNSFWDYVNRWNQIFPESRALRWENDWLENDYCADCRFCCGKQDSATPFPMPLLPGQYRSDLEHDFHLLDSLTPYLSTPGCRSCTDTGCRLSHGQKPVACGLFPVVLVNGGLYLYMNCPAVMFLPLIRFFELGQKAASMLMDLEFADLRRLSLWLGPETLSRSYIDLRIRLFDERGKALLFE